MSNPITSLRYVVSHRVCRWGQTEQDVSGVTVRSDPYGDCMELEDLGIADPAEIEVAREYLTLRSRLAEARERADRLRRLADHVEQRASDDEQLLRELEGALGMRAQLQIEQLDSALRGRRLAEVAVAILRRETRPGQAVHYRDWFALLTAAGFRVNGKDPLASFLAQVSRAPEVEAVGERSGRYRLKAA